MQLIPSPFICFIIEVIFYLGYLAVSARLPHPKELVAQMVGLRKDDKVWSIQRGFVGFVLGLDSINKKLKIC